MSRGLAFRERLLQGEECSFEAEITADFGDKLYTFLLNCQGNADGSLSFSVQKPDTISGISGTVKEITLMRTKLATPDNKYVFIPNGAVTSAQIVNYTVLGKRRVDVAVAAAYICPVADVLEALKKAGRVDTILPEEGVTAVIDHYGDHAIHYSLRVWSTANDYWTTLFAINENIKRVFDARGITMTYPHLNVHLDK